MEPAPQRPKPPGKPWRLRLEKGMKRTGWVAGPLLGGAAGWFAGTNTGGWAAAAGVAGGIAAIPVGAGLGLLGGMAVGWLIDKVSGKDDWALNSVFGMVGLGGLAAPVGGYFFGSAVSGTWWGVGAAAACALGGLAIGWGLPALLLDDSSLQYEYESKLRDHDQKLETYNQDYSAWEQRRAKVLSEESKANLTIEKEEKKVVVGGVTLGRKNRA
ncbi:MAG: hypothetical protein HY319_06380 [Armatimonadetes bacterium]|nr:hypothetical protein [Armatimonadota bacterium]